MVGVICGKLVDLIDKQIKLLKIIIFPNKNIIMECVSDLVFSHNDAITLAKKFQRKCPKTI